MITVDANEATADVAYRSNEVVAIYPITPASVMGEHADAWAARRIPNIWGGVPDVIEMQSEGGAAGAVHGSLQSGALTTSFTASQGLLLMIPNLYKIAGELTPCVLHIAARSIATHALSIFGDHSDVYAARQTGFAMLASNSGQESHDFALIAQMASLASRVPFLHFFDGFRTSHEITKIARLGDADLLALLDADLIRQYRERALSPDHPCVRGTAQNPDAFFQAREAVNRYYAAVPDLVEAAMKRFEERVGRHYGPVEYEGAVDAERVIVIMGSGADTVHETVDHLCARGEKVGLLKLRLYRPFPTRHLLEALPSSARFVAVLDRTKEPGATGEPLYLDVVAVLHQAAQSGQLERVPTVIGGRYGLSSKEFNPAMVAGIYEELERSEPRRSFSVGILDDVTHASVPYDEAFDIEADDVVRCIFYGLGSDGTVGANKNSIKIIGENTDHRVQAYFVYDSKKSGAITISHLRFGPRPIRSHYLIGGANFVACHQWAFVDKYDVLEHAAEQAVLLLNSPFGPEEVWGELPLEMQQQIIEKKIRLYAIDAYSVARESGMGRRINTVMQTCFFAIADILPTDRAIEAIKGAIRKTYGSRGQSVVEMNCAAVDASLAELHEIVVPARADATRMRPPVVPEEAPDFVQNVTALMLAGRGDRLPVSAFAPDGTWPSGTTRWERRNVALEIPVWDEGLCIQCNKCALVCPHAAVRVKCYPNEAVAGAPEHFKHVRYRAKEWKEHSYTVQVAPEDCTGCTLCVEVCPARDKSNPRRKALGMAPQVPLRDQERECFDFFLNLPELPREEVVRNVKLTQFLEPLFEFSGACSGCGETPYVKLLTQLFGDRLLVANATGCSSIYGGNLPTTPYTKNREGRGPAWSNSLFEDNAEFGLGMRMAVDQQAGEARRLLRVLAGELGEAVVQGLLEANRSDEAGVIEQRRRVAALKAKLAGSSSPDAQRLLELADCLVERSVWIVGGDGWAYDIGYGGLDHVLASGKNVNVLVLDTEVYSNTGGQKSKATPLAAVAKFAADGKARPKKDLGLLAMAYGDVYVASVAFGAKDTQTVRAFVDAESYSGASLIIAYSHCIAHGYDLSNALEQQKLAVKTGYWPLYRYDPRQEEGGVFPLRLDSAAPKGQLQDFLYNETRFRMLQQSNPERAAKLLESAQHHVERRRGLYEQLAVRGQKG